MAYPVPGTREALGATRRREAWWAVPAAMAATFLVFVVYASWAAFQPIANAYFPNQLHPTYISPFYSPDLTRFIPGFTWSPSLLILWLPAGFRLTCYYGRKAYYRSVMLQPAACAVGKGDRNYKGETAFPWVLNNLHRFFLYLITIMVVFHWIHLFEAFHFQDGWGLGLGSIVVTADTVFLSLYVFGCHSLRHLVGGRIDCYSCASAGLAQHKAWQGVSILNERHNLFFWLSLISVGFADVYVRMCSTGVWSDWRIF